MSADPKNVAPKDVVPKEKAAEPNALLAGLTGLWARFKQGKLISYKLMAVLLIGGAALGLWWYLSAGAKKAASARWAAFVDASDWKKLEELAKADPGSPLARVCELRVASARLGPEGIDLLAADKAEPRQKAPENIEAARDALTRLLPELRDDPVLKAECLYGLARAEAMLIGLKKPAAAPAPGPGPVAPPKDEYRGSVPKLIEYLDQLSAAAAPDTPWATDSKKLADVLRKDPAQFVRVQQTLAGYQGGFGLPGGGGPLAPPTPPIFP